MAWQVNAEVANFLGAGSAVLLQLAHPYVAYGIAEHSQALTDVRSRFVGTFQSVYRMTFGSRSQALQCARVIHQVHSRISGSLGEGVGRFAEGHHYHANDVGALRWVFATLISTALQVHTSGGLRLSPLEKSEFYLESKKFALLFGLRGEMLPVDLDEFEAYMREQRSGDALGVSRPARDIAHFLLTAPYSSLEPVFAVYRSVTAKFLGARLSSAYGLPFGAKEQALASLALGAARPLRRLSPAGLRRMPDALRAESKLGLRRSSRISPWFEQLVHRSLERWPSRS